MVKTTMTDSGHERALADVAELLGYGSGFKEEQEEAIRSILTGKDTFVSLPSGYGKSLICAALPMVFDRVLDRSRRGNTVVTKCGLCKSTYIPHCHGRFSRFHTFRLVLPWKLHNN